MITAGPTYEQIDPVRFIGNNSSGKMGYALAKVCLEAGANVKLISGPTKEVLVHNSLKITHVTSAEEMLAECEKNHSNSLISIFCAAVADYKPSVFVDKKIKKSEKNLTIDLTKNPDIAATLGKVKESDQIHVGFALETNNEEFNAKEKLMKKNFDMIVLNSLKDKGAGFKGDSNKISIIQENKIDRFELKSKYGVANDILDAIIEKLND